MNAVSGNQTLLSDGYVGPKSGKTKGHKNFFGHGLKSARIFRRSESPNNLGGKGSGSNLSGSSSSLNTEGSTTSSQLDSGLGSGGSLSKDFSDSSTPPGHSPSSTSQRTMPLLNTEAEPHAENLDTLNSEAQQIKLSPGNDLNESNNNIDSSTSVDDSERNKKHKIHSVFGTKFKFTRRGCGFKSAGPVNSRNSPLPPPPSPRGSSSSLSNQESQEQVLLSQASAGPNSTQKNNRGDSVRNGANVLSGSADSSTSSMAVANSYSAASTSSDTQAVGNFNKPELLTNPSVNTINNFQEKIDELHKNFNEYSRINSECKFHWPINIMLIINLKESTAIRYFSNAIWLSNSKRLLKSLRNIWRPSHYKEIEHLVHQCYDEWIAWKKIEKQLRVLNLRNSLYETVSSLEKDFKYEEEYKRTFDKIKGEVSPYNNSNKSLSGNEKNLEELEKNCESAKQKFNCTMSKLEVTIDKHYDSARRKKSLTPALHNQHDQREKALSRKYKSIKDQGTIGYYERKVKDFPMIPGEWHREIENPIQSFMDTVDQVAVGAKFLRESMATTIERHPKVDMHTPLYQNASPATEHTKIPKPSQEKNSFWKRYSTAIKRGLIVCGVGGGIMIIVGVGIAASGTIMPGILVIGVGVGLGYVSYKLYNWINKKSKKLSEENCVSNRSVVITADMNIPEFGDQSIISSLEQEDHHAPPSMINHSHWINRYPAIKWDPTSRLLSLPEN